MHACLSTCTRTRAKYAHHFSYPIPVPISAPSRSITNLLSACRHTPMLFNVEPISTYSSLSSWMHWKRICCAAKKHLMAIMCLPECPCTSRNITCMNVYRMSICTPPTIYQHHTRQAYMRLHGHTRSIYAFQFISRFKTRT